MFSKFNIWSTTTRGETRPDYATYKSRRARVAPYPTRLTPSDGQPSDGYSLDDIRKPLRPKVPKPMFYFDGTTDPGPSNNPESTLVALEYHQDVGGASPAPDNLVVNPAPEPSLGPLENQQEYNAAANPSSKVAKPMLNFDGTTDPGPSNNPESTLVALEYHQDVGGASPAPDNLVVSPAPEPSLGPLENQQEYNAAADPSSNPPAFGPLVLSTGPPENPEFVVAPRPAPEPLALPTPQLNFNLAVQDISSQSPTRLDLRKYRPKRQYSGDTGDKARLVPQDVLTTRMAIQEKDQIIELLRDELAFNRKNMELLTLRMDDITKELKAKDTLLASAKGQARLSQDSSKQPHSNIHEDKDEDMYFGDSEADKLRGERRIKKGLRKAMREAKGKARQVEDEDEGMENSDISESNKARHVENEDEDEEMENSGTGEPDKARHVENEDKEIEHSDINGDVNYDKDDEVKKGLRKAMREAKGKARQIEDEDEGMENSDISEPDKARHVENEDEEIEHSDIDGDVNYNKDDEVIEAGPSSWTSSVPRPYIFSKPKGGAGPRLRAQTSQIPPDDRDSNSESDEPLQPLNTIPNPLNLPHDALVALTNTVLGVIGQRDDLLASRMKRRRIVSQKIKQPTIRESKTRRKQLGAMFREDMNCVLEIARDKDIVLKTPPSNKEVEAFAEEKGPGPDLKPMRLSFDVTSKHAWNTDLAEQFVGNFMEYREIEKDEEALVYELFAVRFTTLKRRYREWQLKRGEDTVQRAQRVKEMHIVERRMRRRDTRRNNLFADRSQIALDNREIGDSETVDPVWDFLYNTTRLLRSEGMSSDESGQEGSGPPYYIKTRDWRSRDLIPYLQMIDRDRTRTNAYGNNRAGNPPRERQRIGRALSSDRKAIPDLPINFYDKTWYAGLSRRDRAILKPKSILHMPALVAYD